MVSCLPTEESIIKNKTSSEEENKENEVLIDGKTKDEFFSFVTSKQTKVRIDYGLSDYQVDFSIYIDNPINKEQTEENPSYILEDLDPILAGFTNESGYFEGTVSLPEFVDTVYIVTRAFGVSPCSTILVSNNEIYLSPATSLTTKSGVRTRSMSPSDASYQVGTNIIKWADATVQRGAVYALFDQLNASQIRNTVVPNLYRSITSLNALEVNSRKYTTIISPLQNRLGYYSDNNDIGRLIAEQSYEKGLAGNMDDYFTVKTTGTDSVEIEVMMYIHGGFNTAIGYYFYKSDQSLSESEIRKLPKYILYPNTSATSEIRDLVRLQYITNTGGTLSGQSKFPAGYTIGFIEMSSSVLENGSTDLEKLKKTATKAYANGHTSYSNLSKNGEPGSLFLRDTETDGIFVGFEDFYSSDISWTHSVYNYSDPILYVYSNPSDGIKKNLLPPLPGASASGTITSQTRGVLLFEDQWPSLGDYDTNDAMISYKTIVTADKSNNVISIEDRFTPIQGVAKFINGFGFVYNDNGNVNAGKSTPGIIREGSKQYLMIPDLNHVSEGSTFSLFRDVSNLNLSAYSRVYNVYIVPNYDKAPATDRKEIHLPKYDMTPLGDKDLLGTESDAWFIYKDGDYPFSINLSGVNGNTFIPVDETKRIGSVGNYPLYDSWVQSNGVNNKNWYKSKN